MHQQKLSKNIWVFAIWLFFFVNCGHASPKFTPTQPQLQVADVASDKVVLSWTPSTVAKSSIKSYLIFRNGTQISTVPSSQTSFTDLGLNAATRYSYAVAAMSSRGIRSALSEAVSVETSTSMPEPTPAPPPAPEPTPTPPPPSSGTKTVTPIESNEILTNPGMGFADFGILWGGAPLPLSQYPTPSTAYPRWYWSELEPNEGQFNFALVDNLIAEAKRRGQTVAWRIMPAIPAWLKAKGVGQFGTTTDDQLPDHNHPLFLQYHERLIQVFSARYANSLDIDRMDIGSVGCWGEWNSACCPAGKEAMCEAYMPNSTNTRKIIDWYFKYFPTTPLIALDATINPLSGGDSYATSRGAGWRADCFGDYGMFGPNWNHMVSYYPAIFNDAINANAWKRAPVDLEVCGVVQDWYDLGFDIDLILQKGLEYRVSILNAKSRPIPTAWRPKFDAWLKKIGYRFVINQFSHSDRAPVGGTATFSTVLTNKGVAPVYHKYPVSYRLRNSAGAEVARFTSTYDLRNALPGTHNLTDTFTVPAYLPPGVYQIDIGVLDRTSSKALLQLAITGKRADTWYPLSSLEIY